MLSMQLSRSLPSLKNKSSFIRLDDKQLEKNIDHLMKEIEGMETEYEAMDNPIKTDRPISFLTIDEILWTLLTDN